MKLKQTPLRQKLMTTYLSKRRSLSQIREKFKTWSYTHAHKEVDKVLDILLQKGIVGKTKTKIYYLKTSNQKPTSNANLF